MASTYQSVAPVRSNIHVVQRELIQEQSTNSAQRLSQVKLIQDPPDGRVPAVNTSRYNFSFAGTRSEWSREGPTRVQIVIACPEISSGASVLDDFSVARKLQLAPVGGAKFSTETVVINVRAV